MSSDTNNPIWAAASAKVRQHAPADALPVVVRRVTEDVYAQMLDDAAAALHAHIEEKTNDH